MRALGSLPRFSGRASARTWLLSIALRSRVARARDDLMSAANRDDQAG